MPWTSKERLTQLQSDLDTARKAVLHSSVAAARFEGELATLKPLIEFYQNVNKDLLDRLARAMGVAPLHQPPTEVEKVQLGLDTTVDQEPVNMSQQANNWVTEAQRMEDLVIVETRRLKLEKFALKRGVQMKEEDDAKAAEDAKKNKQSIGVA